MSELGCTCTRLIEAEAKAAMSAGVHWMESDGAVEAWCCPVRTAVSISKDMGITLKAHHLFMLLNKCKECDRTWSIKENA